MTFNVNKRLLIAVCLLIPAWFAYVSENPVVKAATVRYVSQSGGVFSGGTACNGQTAISVSAFNGTAESAGDLNYLCGTITSAVAPTGNGANGNPVTIQFDTGASISMPFLPTTGAIVLTNLQFYLVNGGGGSCGYVSNGNVPCTIGTIQSTANGSGLANQVASVAIEAGGSTGVEIRSLGIGPVYTHTSPTDLTQSPPGPIAVHFVGATSINIHNDTIHDCAWCLTGNASGLTVQNNEIYNADNGVGVGGTNSAVNIFANHFHDWANWDTSNNSLHHDGVHLFDIAGQTFNGANVYANLFDGDQGNNVTGMLYFEHSAATGTIQNIVWYNNVAIIKPGRISNLGWFACWSTATGTGSTCSSYYNTVLAAYVAGSGTCFGFNGWTGVTFEGNSSLNCQNNIGITATVTLTAVDYNSYDDIGTDQGIGGAANTFVWHGSFFSSFTTWKADCSCDSHGIFNALANIKVNAIGRQLAGSPLIGSGLNLSSLGITNLNIDFFSNNRPGASTPWDMGAYFGIGVATPIPSPSQPIILGEYRKPVHIEGN